MSWTPIQGSHKQGGRPSRGSIQHLSICPWALFVLNQWFQLVILVNHAQCSQDSVKYIMLDPPLRIRTSKLLFPTATDMIDQYNRLKQ